MRILINYLRTNFYTDNIRAVQKLLFPLKRKILCKIKEIYLDSIFIDNYLKYNVLRNHMHFIIIDLLDYKIKPYNLIILLKLNLKLYIILVLLIKGWT